MILILSIPSFASAESWVRDPGIYFSLRQGQHLLIELQTLHTLVQATSQRIGLLTTLDHEQQTQIADFTTQVENLQQIRSELEFQKTALESALEQSQSRLGLSRVFSSLKTWGLVAAVGAIAALVIAQ